jgi:hypothetical protein
VITIDENWPARQASKEELAAVQAEFAEKLQYL